MLGLPFALVGAVVADRQPRQPFGWLLLAMGALLAVSLASDSFVSYGVAHDGSWVDPGYPALASNLTFSLFLLLLITTLLLLPNGRLPSPRWRVCGIAVAVLAAIDLALVFRPGRFDDWEEEAFVNPSGSGRSLDSST